MTKQRIAVLFDAENIPCKFAGQVLSYLRPIHIVQSACAVGDFTLLSGWMDLVDHQALVQAVRAKAPETAQKLQGKFLKSLVANGLVTRIGSGAGQRLKMTG